MEIVINPGLDTPIYLQLYESIRRSILTGALGANTCLPPIRTIAKELSISVITVKKAWEELEHAGLIYTVTGKGCFVADIQPQGMEEKKKEMLLSRMREDWAYYRSFGLTRAEILAIFGKME